MRPLFMNESELQILLNLLDDDLTIEYPPYDFDLFTAKPKGTQYEFDASGKKKEFEKIVYSHPECLDELPDYHDYMDCMLSSGVIGYDNAYDFHKLLTDLRGWPETKQACFCPDTNILYHRFFSNFGKIKTNEVVLIKTTEQEIKAALSHRYDQHTIDVLRKLKMSRKQLFDEIIHGRTKNARRAMYLAQPEYRRMKNNPLHILSGVEESRPDNEYNDAIIVKTACEARQKGFEYLFLLTADAGVSRRCEEVSLRHFLFKVPMESHSSRCSSYEFCEFLYNLARVFGFIKINSVILFGEFRDKDQAKPNQLKVEIANEHLFAEAKRHLTICRGLSALGIKE
jgi:hypothetical protein